VKFIFATTEPHKIPITILSRCQRFDFAGIRASQIQARLLQIARAEGVEVDPDALQIVASRAAGSMRDSQSLLEQLLAVADSKISAADVTQLLGIAPAERLTGLVGHLVERDARSALTELDAAIDGGVEVGQLLDQLVGYFRDVMTAAVGAAPDQMLYALPSQAGEVAESARRLGVETILAIVQILDQTAARMRFSMHGRTLVELAVVRICQLENLDDLASLVAELRGEEVARPQAAVRTSPAPPAKKNIEAQPMTGGLGAIPTLPPIEHSPIISPPAAATDGSNGANALPDSVLKRYQEVMSAAPAAPTEPRITLRQQMAEHSREASSRPFVQRAMELFEVPPGKFRYAPPEGEAD
jgi:DNA polymerase-3 subunit gamma/tau